MQPYAEQRGHDSDFLVRYQLIPADQGGRAVTFQHIRCDFHYADENLETDGIYMIHPEFLDQEGLPISDGAPIASQGIASMWILVPEMRAYHQKKLSIGTRGFFMEGSRRIASAQVIRIVGLHINPRE